MAALAAHMSESLKHFQEFLLTKPSCVCRYGFLVVVVNYRVDAKLPRANQHSNTGEHDTARSSLGEPRAATALVMKGTVKPTSSSFKLQLEEHQHGILLNRLA